MNDQAPAMAESGAVHVSRVVDAIMQHVRCQAGCDGEAARADVAELIRTEFVHLELESRSIIDAAASTIAELQELLTSTAPPAIDLIRELASRKSCELGRELGVSIDDVLELGVVAARVVRMSETSSAILANAA